MKKNKKLIISLAVVSLVSAMVYWADSTGRSKNAGGKVLSETAAVPKNWQIYENRNLAFAVAYPDFLELVGKPDCISGGYNIPPAGNDSIFYLRSKENNSMWFYIQVSSVLNPVLNYNTAFLGRPAEIKTIKGFDGKPENDESVLNVERNNYLYVIQKTPMALSGATQKEIDEILSTFKFID